MAQPPNFGGTEIEEGLEEDLGVPAAELRHAAPAPAGSGNPESNEATAPGEICARCGAQISEGQDARHRPDGRWVHEICPG
jgi:hypothetical protein